MSSMVDMKQSWSLLEGLAITSFIFHLYLETKCKHWSSVRTKDKENLPQMDYNLSRPEEHHLPCLQDTAREIS